VKELEYFGVAQPIDLRDMQDERLALCLADFLGKPLEGLVALVTIGQDIGSPTNSYRTNTSQTPPEGDPRAGVRACGQRIDQHKPFHKNIVTDIT
jgi:hypothetical protein